MMKNTLINLFVFAAGAAIGSAVTWKYLKDEYERIAQEDAKSVRETYAKMYAETSKPGEDDIMIDLDELCKEPEEEEDEETVTLFNYGRILNDADYSKEELSRNRPYVISPEEFGDIDDYDTISITYFKDKVLAYLDLELVEDADDVIGLDSLNHFGQYEDDSVFVRNDMLKADYEILLDPKNYSDVINEIPHPAED